MGVMLSDLSRTVTDPFRLDGLEFPRVLWPEDWRLPHLRGFEDWGDRQRQRGRDFRRHRIWRSGTTDWGAREDEDQRRRLERKLTRAERDTQRHAPDGRGRGRGRRLHSSHQDDYGDDLDDDRDHGPAKTTGIDPLDNLQRYVRKARVDLRGFGWAPPPRRGVKPGWDRAIEQEEDETRRRRDEAFEVLQGTRRGGEHRLRLNLVKRAHPAQWNAAVKAYLSSQLPSTPLLASAAGPSIFALPSANYATLDWDQPHAHASDMGRAVQFLHQTILVTALSVLCAIRSEERDGLWEDDDVPTVLEGFSFYRVASPTSPLSDAAARTLVLLDTEDSDVRVALLEVQRPRERVFEEFAKSTGFEFELTAKEEVFHREAIPHPAVAQANALQAHIFASCVENNVEAFILTDVHTWVFGHVDPKEKTMTVSPVLTLFSRDPSIFEALVHLILQAFDRRPNQPLRRHSTVPRAPSNGSAPSSSRSSHARSHSTPYPTTPIRTSSTLSRAPSYAERDLPPLPPSSTSHASHQHPRHHPGPSRPSSSRPVSQSGPDPAFSATSSRRSSIAPRAGDLPAQHARPQPSHDRHRTRRDTIPGNFDSSDEDDYRNEGARIYRPHLPGARPTPRRTRVETTDSWDEEEIAWERDRQRRDRERDRMDLASGRRSQMDRAW